MAARKTKRVRYAIVGTGGRSINFIKPLATTYRKQCEIVGFCDTNQGRMDYYNNELVHTYAHPAVPTFAATDFEQMIRQAKPDFVIVTTIDSEHDRYIVRALELGCDAITEKPLTTEVRKCRAIFDAVKRTGRNVRVTFNYRWTPGTTLVKQLLAKNTIGEILQVNMEYLLNTSHGADYFRRWHREKDKSGGLIVHKSTHHFDLINWWLDAVPEQVFGYGRLAYYGRENAEKRGIRVKYDRYTGHNTTGDRFAMKLDGGGDQRVGVDRLRGLYLDAEKYDGYVRDRNVFGDGITSEDTMSVLVRYRTGTVLNYSLNAYLPREGFRVSFNGTKGRLDYEEAHSSHVGTGSAPDKASRGDVTWTSRLIVQPEFAKAYEVEIPKAAGGHGGSDPRLAHQMFHPKPPKEKWGRNAGHEQGAASIMIGIAANKCFVTGKPVNISSIFKEFPKNARLSELV